MLEYELNLNNYFRQPFLRFAITKNFRVNQND